MFIFMFFFIKTSEEESGISWCVSVTAEVQDEDIYPSGSQVPSVLLLGGEEVTSEGKTLFLLKKLMVLIKKICKSSRGVKKVS